MLIKFSSFRSSVIVASAAAGTLTGCAISYAPSEQLIGQSRGQVIAALGQPNPRPSKIEDTRRLDFPRGPFGKHTYSVYFDANGRATGFKQLLTEDNFKAINPGMDQSEVIDRIGVATDTFGLARKRGYVWNFRYENYLCKWFQIEFSAEHKVRSAGYGVPPECRHRFLLLR